MRISDLEPIADPADPDDWRPRSRWALMSDPDVAIAVIVEQIASGERIPLHRHRIDELVIYDSGLGEVVVDGTREPVGAPSIVFIPAGAAHSTINTGGEPLRLHAIFPSHEIDIEYIERNPAPGTEGDAPQPPSVYDARTGEVRPL